MECLSPEEVQSRVISNNSVLLDVRSPEEVLKSGTLPSAQNIPLRCLQECDVGSPSIESLQLITPLEVARDAGKDIIVFCATGCRAATAFEILDGLGFPTSLAPSFATLREIFLQTGE